MADLTGRISTDGFLLAVFPTELFCHTRSIVQSSFDLISQGPREAETFFDTLASRSDSRRSTREAQCSTSRRTGIEAKREWEFRRPTDSFFRPDRRSTETPPGRPSVLALMNFLTLAGVEADSHRPERGSALAKRIHRGLTAIWIWCPFCFFYTDFYTPHPSLSDYWPLIG